MRCFFHILTHTFLYYPFLRLYSFLSPFFTYHCPKPIFSFCTVTLLQEESKDILSMNEINFSFFNNASFSSVLSGQLIKVIFSMYLFTPQFYLQHYQFSFQRLSCKPINYDNKNASFINISLNYTKQCLNWFDHHHLRFKATISNQYQSTIEP